MGQYSFESVYDTFMLLDGDAEAHLKDEYNAPTSSTSSSILSMCLFKKSTENGYKNQFLIVWPEQKTSTPRIVKTHTGQRPEWIDRPQR